MTQLTTSCRCYRAPAATALKGVTPGAVREACSKMFGELLAITTRCSPDYNLTPHPSLPLVSLDPPTVAAPVCPAVDRGFTWSSADLLPPIHM